MSTQRLMGTIPSDFSLGSIRGIPIRVHVSFFVLLGLELLSSLRVIQITPLYFVLILFLYGPILMMTVILHELGHALMTVRLGGQVKGIFLWPLGGYVICGATDRGGVSGDLIIAAAGPAMHLPQMLFWFLVHLACTGGELTLLQPEVYLDVLDAGFVGFLIVTSSMAFFMNLFIMAFNLFVPAYPLDGGYCMAATLVLLGFTVQKAAMITSLMAMMVSCLLGILGVYSFFAEHNPNGAFTTVVAAYIFLTSKEMYDVAKAGQAREHPLFDRSCYDERDANESVVEEQQRETEIIKGNFA